MGDRFVYVCAWCGAWRWPWCDYWTSKDVTPPPEGYEYSHGICPECNARMC
jgi:hypothetical protein